MQLTSLPFTQCKSERSWVAYQWQIKCLILTLFFPHLNKFRFRDQSKLFRVVPLTWCPLPFKCSIWIVLKQVLKAELKWILHITDRIALDINRHKRHTHFCPILFGVMDKCSLAKMNLSFVFQMFWLKGFLPVLNNILKGHTPFLHNVTFIIPNEQHPYFYCM